MYESYIAQVFFMNYVTSSQPWEAVSILRLLMTKLKIKKSRNTHKDHANSRVWGQLQVPKLGLLPWSQVLKLGLLPWCNTASGTQRPQGRSCKALSMRQLLLAAYACIQEGTRHSLYLHPSESPAEEAINNQRCMFQCSVVEWGLQMHSFL